MRAGRDPVALVQCHREAALVAAEAAGPSERAGVERLQWLPPEHRANDNGGFSPANFHSTQVMRAYAPGFKAGGRMWEPEQGSSEFARIRRHGQRSRILPPAQG